MKKLILLAIISLMLLSCNNSVIIKNPEKETTYEEMTMVKDTMLVVANEQEQTVSCYDIKTNMKIYEVLHLSMTNQYLFIFMSFVFGLILGIFLTNN